MVCKFYVTCEDDDGRWWDDLIFADTAESARRIAFLKWRDVPERTGLIVYRAREDRSNVMSAISKTRQPKKDPTMWQPIETAPIGRLVLLWWRPVSDPRYPHPPEAASKLSNNKHAEGCVLGSIVDPKDYDAAPSQWWDGHKYQDIWHVTHWQELPARPEGTELKTRKPRHG